MTTSTIEFESRNKTLLVTSWTEIMTSQPLFQNSFILRRPKVAIFAHIIKIITMYIKKIFKLKKKLKELEIMHQNAIYICISWCSKILLITGQKMLMSAELKGCVTWFIYFLDLL